MPSSRHSPSQNLPRIRVSRSSAVVQRDTELNARVSYSFESPEEAKEGLAKAAWHSENVSGKE